MAQSRLDIAKADIFQAVMALGQKPLMKRDLDTILGANRSSWRVAQRTTTEEFIRFLTQRGSLRRLDFRFPNRLETRFTWGELPLLEVIQSLRPTGYFCHYTASKAHGFTVQVPKTIYLNVEQETRSNPNAKLDPARVAAAFAKPQRTSNDIALLDDYRLCIVHGQNTGQAGVVTQNIQDAGGAGSANVRITSPERTLIDMVVRPAYSGGVAEVLEAYRAAQGQISVNHMIAILKRIGYVYPYHQAIGYYLQRAGYPDSAINIVREIPTHDDFYLTHEMTDMEYIKEWMLFVPKGFNLLS